MDASPGEVVALMFPSVKRSWTCWCRPPGVVLSEDGVRSPPTSPRAA